MTETRLLNLERLAREALDQAREARREAAAVRADAPSARVANWHGAASGPLRNRLFDLYAVKRNSFRVRGGTAKDAAAAWIGNVPQSVGASGLTWDSDGHWSVSGVSETKWVWLDLATDGAAVATLRCGAALPLPGAEAQDRIEPLWYIPWDGTNGRIDRTGIMDLRTAKRAELLDGISLAHNADGNHSLRAFDDILDNLVPIDLDNDVYIPVTEATEGEDHEIRYSNLNDMVQEIIDIIEEYIEEEVVIVGSWDGLNDTSGTPGIEMTHGYIPVSDKNSGSLDLKEPSEAGLPFWIQDSDYEDCYGSSIGNSAQELVIDLDNQELVTAFTAKMDFTVENELFANVIKDLDEDSLTIDLGTGILTGASMQVDLRRGLFELLNDDDLPFPEDNWFRIERSAPGEVGSFVDVSGVLRSWDLESAVFDLYSTDVFRLGLNLDEETDVLETVNPLSVESPELALRGTTSLDLQYGATGVRFGPEDEDPSTFPEATAMEVVLQASPTSPPQRVRILGAVLGAV